MKILITGGAGFIGSRLCLALLKLGNEITVIDSLSEQVHGKNPSIDSSTFQLINGRVSFIIESILNKNILIDCIKKVDLIVHLASETGTGQSMYEIERYNQVNVMGTSLICDILMNQDHHVKKIVLASSRSIYGEGKYLDEKGNILYPKNRKLSNLQNKKFDFYSDDGNSRWTPLPTDENSAINPISIYAATKYYQELLLRILSNSINIDTTILRLQNVYGPGQSLNNPYTGILSIFSTQILNNIKLNIFEDGEESRDFIFVDDVVSAFVKSIESSVKGLNIYNVGSGVLTSVKKISQLLHYFYGKDENSYISGDYRIGDIRNNYADLTRANSDLKFSPKVNINDGIKLFSKWVLDQKLNSDNSSLAINELMEKGLYK